MKRKLTVIMALALALVLAMGISTAFAAGLQDDDKTGGFQTYGPDENSYTPALEGTGRNSLDLDPEDQYPDLDAGDAAFYDNANKTGWLPLRKALDNQTVHGQYKKNTNSCASCHMTHTAAGASLLFRNGIYNTCSACHDGSMDIYNVFADGADLKAILPSGQYTAMGADQLKAGGGTFGGMKGASAHLATGDLALKAAPGGNRVENNPGSPWVGDFTCASCHAPHGSYSHRLLHYSPNKVGSTKPELGGFQYETTFNADATAAEKGQLVKVDGYYFIKGEAKDVAATFANRDKTPWLYGYDGRTKDRWTAIVTMNPDGTYNYGGVFGVNAQTGNPVLWDSQMPVSWGKAYFKDPDNKLDGKNGWVFVVSPALTVKFNMAGTAAETGFRAVNGYGNGSNDINKFCAACHTDYNQKVDYTNDANNLVVAGAGLAQSNAGATEGLGIAATLRGTFTKGFRHNITGRSANVRLPGNATSMSCLTCHYAHGTTQEIMYDATNVLDTTKDLNPSSALKRYTNMAVCIRCHTSSHAITLKNNAGYWGTDATVGTGDGYEIYKSHEGYGMDGGKKTWLP